MERPREPTLTRRLPGPSHPRSRRSIGLAAALLAWALGAACLAPGPGVPPPEPPSPAVSVFVARHAWHTGIVLRRQDIPARLWPERDDFPGLEYLEIGWGDRQFYQAREPSSGMALRAAFLSGPSVLHVAGFSGPVTRFFAGAEVLEARLALPDFERLCAFIAGAHARDPAGRSIPLGAGLYGASRFYAGRERYSVVATCNTWTARALRAAGLSVIPARALTAGNVMRQLRAIGLGPPRDP